MSPVLESAAVEAPALPKTDVLPLPEEGLGSLGYWQSEIQAAKDQIAKLLPEWQKNLQRYQNKPLDAAPTKDTIWVPKDFALAERKRPQLWHQLPELFAQPKPGQPLAPLAGPVFSAVLNQYLADEDHFNADVVMTECTFDTIVPAGLMVSKICYEAFVDGEKPAIGADGVPSLIPDPEGAIDPLTGGPALVPEMVPNVLKERYVWHRISPANLLLPADWTGSDYDRAPWIGWRFERDREEIKTLFKLTDDDLGDGEAPSESLNKQEDKTSDKPNRRVIRGVELFYYASRYDGTVKHPDRMRWMVLLGVSDKDPVIHKDSPYQTVLPDGKLSADSLIGHPIHVGTLRTISDGKFPNSDCQQSRPQVDELSMGRTQMIQQRNRSIPMRAADKSRLDPTTQQKLQAGEYQEIIFTEGPPEGILAEVVRAQYPRENFSFNEQIEQDLEETWAIGSNQLAGDTAGQTATEASIKQRNTDARLATEQARVKKYFLTGVRKCATLIQRYADTPDYVEIVGPGGEKILQQWDKTQIQGKFLWTMKPDAQLRTDANQERKFRMDAYQVFRRDPLINAAELVKWVFEPWGMGGQFIAPPPPPQEPPPRVSVSVKGEDLDPGMPQYPNIVTLLTADGVTGLSAQTAQPATLAGGMPHGGPMPGAEPINKHLQDATGNMPGPSGETNTGAV